MRDLIVAALSFPAALFTFLLAVAVVFWVLVALGLSGVEALDGVDGTGGATLAGLGLGGVPISVALSLVVALSWSGCLAGTLLLPVDGLSRVAVIGQSFAVLLAAVLVAVLLTRLVVVALRRVFAAPAPPALANYVGLVCVVRTGRVDGSFGQAEVTALDGSTTLVQVRQSGAEPLRVGSRAVVHGYDPDGGFFRVAPVDLDRPAP
ncbi:hypothetical protein [Actinokineospora bangkokensis]|uniref:DUF1449 domain-containing protein n=1 Tax=Actinokineospora bangkokensis TaxID=1193682 RepID=A0A1Q9LFP7_9PSEU|nr:hypothetical protein [Actinokineospora bangkokensis]OLR90840.1 hypothetical protein BJP25_30205 [Actinokineospora bangkokensis]